MKLDVEAMAREAGFVTGSRDLFGVNGGSLRFIKPISAESCSVEIAKFASLIVERCAVEAEDTSQEYEPYTGQELALNYTCAAAIRNLLED